MDPSRSPITGKYNEDPVKHVHLGKPVGLHSHHVIHPRPNDPTSKHIADYLSIFNDDQHGPVAFAKYALKGAFLGASYAITAGTIFKRYNSLALRKISYYVNQNTFGRIHLYKDHILPYAFGGAGLGLAWYGWYHLIWTKHGEQPDLFQQGLGYGIFGSVATALMVHPSLYWAGFYGGGFIGVAGYFLFKGNLGPNKATEGYAIELPGLSKEEREKQRIKDYIHELGSYESISRNNLIDL